MLSKKTIENKKTAHTQTLIKSHTVWEQQWFCSIRNLKECIHQNFSCKF